MRQDLVIDLGSSKTVIIKKDVGVVFKEPTLIVTTTDGVSLKRVASGASASDMIGKTSSAEQIICPIEQGIIVNPTACALMLQDFVDKVIPKTLIKPKISAMVCVSCGLTNLEKHTFETVCNNVGIKEVTVVEAPIAIAGLLHEEASLIVEIGKDKTELAIVNNNGIISGCSVNIGSQNINAAITDYIAAKYKMIVHHNTTEKIKRSIATLKQQDISQVSVNGKSLLQGELQTIKLNANELRASFIDIIDKLADIIEQFTLMIPENIAELIASKGINICGGGAFLPGLEEYLSEKLMIGCNKISQPDEAAANGATKYLYSKERLKKMLNVENLEIE